MINKGDPCGGRVVSVTIDGKGGEFPDGTTILEAADALGISIPVLCNDERIKPAGACRMCLVEVEGRSQPVASCATALSDGMSITTKSDGLYRAREINLRMLARNYPVGAFTASPDKTFHRLAREYGLSEADFCVKGTVGFKDESNPYFRADMSRCIECYRCVRICAELPGQNVWQVMGRGQTTTIVPDGTDLMHSSCISCGACVDSCPTGALEDRSVLELGPALTWTRTVCPYCGTGCEMDVGVANARIAQIRPALESPVNRGHLCVKGRYAYNFVDATDRVTEPMIRRADGWQKVSWDDAFKFTADRLNEIRSSSGPDSIAVLGSSRATNEENYLAQKFARVCIGTNNVDCCARVCHTPTAAAMKTMLGTGAATNSYDDIEKTKLILICGANPTENHPILGERMKQAVLRNGAKLIVIDPRKIELAKMADIHLQLRPGTNILLLNALASVIVEEDLIDTAFVKKRVTDLDQFREFIREYTPENVAERCGVDAATIRSAARLYAGTRPAMSCHGLGITEHLQGTEGVMCVVNLALLTGNIGRPGAGVNPLRGQNNVQGAAHMGCDPGILTGSISLDDGRDSFERVWNAPVPDGKGLNAVDMFDAAGDGKLKALWAIGYDVFLTHPNSNVMADRMSKLNLLIVQDLFMNETAREFANVFFPAVSSFEKDGTFMNAERRVQRVRKTIEPRGSSRSDLEIICEVARAMGHGKSFEFRSAKEVWNEIRSVWPNAAGITYERIESGGLQWNCPDEEHPGTQILHTDAFANGPRASLKRIRYRPTPETATEEFPFILNTGRNLYQFNAGTMTGRTANSEMLWTDFLCIHPDDALKLSITNGETVRIRSRYGQTELPAVITSQVSKGELFATFHSAKVFLNKVTSPVRDRFVQSPEYKVTAVAIERLSQRQLG